MDSAGLEDRARQVTADMQACNRNTSKTILYYSPKWQKSIHLQLFYWSFPCQLIPALKNAQEFRWMKLTYKEVGQAPGFFV